jgi:tetratricopeptide (TPR) repeat protein
MIAATHYARGNAAANEGHPDEAAEQLEKAAEMFTTDEGSVDDRRYADAMLRLGAIREQTDAPKKALDAYRTALDELGEANKQSTLELRIKLRTKYTQLLLHRETWNEATSELQKLVEESDRADDVETKAWALSAVARAQTQTGDQKSARKALERALPLAKNVGDQSLVETIESNLETLAK